MDSEKKWIRDIQRHGSRQAADQLIRAHYDEIFRFVGRQVQNREDALDLTQNIFLAALRALPGFRAEQASFRTWLYRIAANKVIDFRRQRRTALLPLEEETLPTAADCTAQIRDRMLLDQIEEAVAAMDPRIQAVYRLRLYGEQSFPEIAAALGEPESAVKARYYRLVQRLRKEFGYDESLE